jgi:hypothetical protein
LLNSDVPADDQYILPTNYIALAGQTARIPIVVGRVLKDSNKRKRSDDEQLPALVATNDDDDDDNEVDDTEKEKGLHCLQEYSSLPVDSCSPTGELTEDDIAFHAAISECGCKRIPGCFQQFNSSRFCFDGSVDVIKKCRSEVKNLPWKHKKNYIQAKFEHCIDPNSTHAQKRLKMKFQIGYSGSLMLSVCRIAFCIAYGISHYLIDQCATSIRNKKVEMISKLNDRTNFECTFSDMIKKFRSQGILNPTNEMVRKICFDIVYFL